ncbi:hypothetical protein [Synechococcus phage DSL-LC02]|nr:hypothetical protein [Synechococcus phage DSL-LC02]
MSLWGISTTTETQANNYAIPKHLLETDRNTTPWNCFADQRGWVYRRYGTTEHSGLSTTYYDEILVPVAGLNTDGGAANSTGLGAATPVAVFFEDPNKASPISIGAGGTTGIGTATTGYVHVVWNEPVFCSAGATVLIARSTGANIVATAGSFANGSTVTAFVNDNNFVKYTSYDGQISNRISFAFTVPSTGIGTVLSLITTSGVVGTITDFSNVAATKTLSTDLIRNIGGAGSNASTGIGVTTLTIKA